MKKVVCFLLILMLVCSITGCNKEIPGTSAPSDGGNPTTQERPSTTTSASTETTVPAEKMMLFKVPSKEVYFNYPSYLAKFEQSYTEVLFTSKDAVVGICFDFLNAYTGTLDDVYDHLLPYYLDNVSTTSRCTLFGAPYKLVSAESVTVNGLESSRFVAVATGEEGWDCHVYGYSFLIDGLPCAVIGIVSTEEQAADMIAEYDALVDKIAGTTRTKP